MDVIKMLPEYLDFGVDEEERHHAVAVVDGSRDRPDFGDRCWPCCLRSPWEPNTNAGGSVDDLVPEIGHSSQDRVDQT